MEAWKWNGEEWVEISHEEFLGVAEELAVRILNSHEPSRNIPDVFIEAFEQVDN